MNDSPKPMTPQQMSRFWIWWAVISAPLVLALGVLITIGPDRWPDVPIIGTAPILLVIPVLALETGFMYLFMRRQAKLKKAYREQHPEEFPPAAGPGQPFAGQPGVGQLDPGAVPPPANPYQQNPPERSHKDW